MDMKQSSVKIKAKKVPSPAQPPPAGLLALRKTNLSNDPVLMLAAEKYLDLAEKADKLIELSGHKFGPRIFLNSPVMRARLFEAGKADRLDDSEKFEHAKKSMYLCHAEAVHACLIEGKPLMEIGRRHTQNTRRNDITAVAVAFIREGLEQLARHFKLI